MALIKSIKTRSGVLASYWAVERINVHFRPDTFHVEAELAGYVSKEACADCMRPLERKSLSFQKAIIEWGADLRSLVEDYAIFQGTDEDLDRSLGTEEKKPESTFADAVKESVSK